MNIPTLKKYLIQQMSVFPDVPPFSPEKSKVILVTAAGIIEGKLLQSNSEDNEGDFLGKMICGFSDEYEKKILKDGQTLSGNDGFILLSNVTIRNGAIKNDMPLLTVFYDQIIGISIGSVTDR